MKQLILNNNFLIIFDNIENTDKYKSFKYKTKLLENEVA